MLPGQVVVDVMIVVVRVVAAILKAVVTATTAAENSGSSTAPARRRERPASAGGPVSEQMRHKLRTAEGRAVYRQRKVVVEPVALSCEGLTKPPNPYLRQVFPSDGTLAAGQGSAG